MSELAVALFAASTDSHLLVKPRSETFERFRAELDEPSVLADLERRGVRWVPQGDPAYPARLRAIHDPPPGLFARGAADLTLLDAPCVAVVGARACSAYGAAVAAELARGLARAGVVVVSGLAAASTAPRTGAPSRRARPWRCSAAASTATTRAHTACSPRRSWSAA
jgi:predicted Rossmann fold nucleotide-binding protein DprA/Smf involved in DNA uptake